MRKLIFVLTLFLLGCQGPEPTILCMAFGGCYEEVREPKSEVPFVYSVGWWPYQEGLRIQSLEVQILDSRPSVFNAETLVAIVIRGEMKAAKGRRPKITQAQLSQKITKIQSEEKRSEPPEAEITIMPIVDIQSDKAYDGSSIPFSIKQEMILNSMTWGDNIFVIVCGDLKKQIRVAQTK